MLRQPHTSITKGLGLSSCARTRQTAAPRADQWNRSRHLETSSSFKGCDVPEEEGHQRSSEVVVVVFRRRRRRRRHSRRSGLPQRIAPPAGLWRRRGHAKTRHALKSGRHTVKAEHNFKGGLARADGGGLRGGQTMDHVDCARAALRSVAMRPSCAASTWVTSEDKTTFHSFIHVNTQSPSTVITKGRPVAANFARCRGLASTSRKDADGHTRLATSVQ